MKNSIKLNMIYNNNLEDLSIFTKIQRSTTLKNFNLLFISENY